MLPSPLHPAVVHFPIVLMIFLPLVAVGALWAIRRGASPLRAWAAPVALAAALTVSAWAAVESGEAQEDQVESRLSEQAMKAHEESAERFLILSGLVLAIGVAGFARGPIGRAARATATVAAFGLLAPGYAVGHSGGQLVYGKGGIAAVAGGASGGAEPRSGGIRSEPHDD